MKILGSCLAGLCCFAAMSAQAEFSSSQAYEVGGDLAPRAEYVEDINNDGIDDLLTYVDSKLMILFGSPPGSETTFQNKTTLRFFYPVISISSGDFDNDGAIDVVVQTYYGKVEIFRNLDVEPFELELSNSFNTTPGLLQATDYNNDDSTDLIIGNYLYLNDGMGNFSQAAQLPIDDTVGDVNGDGLADVIKEYGQILCGQEDGSFEACARVAVAGGLQISAELNELEGLEIISWQAAGFGLESRTYVTDHCGRGRTYRKRSGTRYVIRGNLYRRTTGCRWSTTIQHSVVTSSALVVSSVAEDGEISEWTSAEIPGVMADLQLADFNGDGAPDVLATNDSQDHFIFLSNSDGTFAVPVGAGVASGRRQLISGDWNGDKWADLAWFVVLSGQDTQLYYALSVAPEAIPSETTQPETTSSENDGGTAPPPSVGSGSTETIEISGSIEVVSDSSITVGGLQIYFDETSKIKFEDDTSGHFEVGQPVEGKVAIDANGMAHAIKIQVGG